MGALIGLALVVFGFMAVASLVGGFAFAIMSPFTHNRLIVRVIVGLLYLVIALFVGALWFGAGPTSAYQTMIDDDSLSGYGTRKEAEPRVWVANKGTNTIRRLAFEAKVRDCSDSASVGLCPLAASRRWGMHVHVPPGERREYRTDVDFQNLPASADKVSVQVTGARSFW